MSLMLLLLALCCPAWAAQLQVQVEDDSLVVGQSVALEVQIIDGRFDGVPEFPVSAGLRSRYRGQGQTRSIIGMKATRVVRYSYQLNALREGDWAVGPFELEVEGTTLRHPAIQIEVMAQPAEDSAQVAVQAEVSDDRPFVGELITYHLEFRRRVEAHSIRWTPPETPGLIAEPSVELAQRDRNQIENGVEESVLDILLPLRATASGSHTISPAVITADLPAPRDPRTGRRPVDVFGRYRLTSKSLPTVPIDLDVRPLPTEGRPADFSGLVGTFTLDVTASETAVAREDTVTLTVELRGTGVLAGFTLPPVPDSPDYRVYDDTPTVEARVTADGLVSAATFRRAVVPLVEGELSIPPVGLTVFDPQLEQYTTISSPPVTLRVRPSSGDGAGAVERFSSGTPDQRRDVEALGDDILPAPGGATIRDRTLAGVMPLVVGLPMLPLLVGLGLLGRAWLGSRTPDPWTLLQARAVPTDPEAKVAALSTLFRDAAALRLGCAPSELDRSRLSSLGPEVVALYTDLEAARFGGGDAAGLMDRVRTFVARKGSL